MPGCPRASWRTLREGSDRRAEQQQAPPPADYRHIRLPGIDQKFNGFGRNPYVATFTAGEFTVSLVNVHLYFGSDSTRSKNRRRLETYAVARWATSAASAAMR